MEPPMTMNGFLAAFAILGYEECRDGTLEMGYEKVVMFTWRDDYGDLEPIRVAKQLGDGRWAGKPGRFEDIAPMDAEAVKGPGYGDSVRFMRRAVLK